MSLLWIKNLMKGSTKEVPELLKEAKYFVKSTISSPKGNTTVNMDLLDREITRRFLRE